LSALPASDLGCQAAAQIADADATLNTQAGAWQSTSPQQQEIQATAKHEDDWYANEQDRRHLKASRFNGDRTSRRVGVFRDFAATAAAAPAWHAGGPSALPARATPRPSTSVRGAAARLSACRIQDIRSLPFQILRVTFQSLPVRVLCQAGSHIAGDASHRSQPFGVWQELGRFGHGFRCFNAPRKTPPLIDSSQQRRHHEGITPVPWLAGCLAILRS